jgi:hypothetical protein
MTLDSREVVVTGPAAPDTVRVFRAVAGSLAMRAGATVEGIDEFRIAVDEAATLLTHAGNPAALVMAVAPSPEGAIGVAIHTDGPLAGWPGDREGSWSWRVISHLTSQAGMGTDEDGCPEIRFVMRPSGTSG